jgi:hypothetical protein
MSAEEMKGEGRVEGREGIHSRISGEVVQPAVRIAIKDGECVRER